MPFNFKDYKLNENNDDIVRSPSKKSSSSGKTRKVIPCQRIYEYGLS